jgi:hypothetical protein
MIGVLLSIIGFIVDCLAGGDLFNAGRFRIYRLACSQMHMNDPEPNYLNWPI